MKPRFHRFPVVFTLWIVSACAHVGQPAVTPSPLPHGPEIRGVFEGVTPCSAQARALPQIPADSDCEQMIWHLTLYQDPQTAEPTTYRLESAYGRSKPNTNELAGGGTSISMQGIWTVGNGSKNDPDATIYEIHSDDPQATVSFLRVSENLLHVLDSEKALLVGNGAWSYTLNRMDNQSSTAASTSPNSFPDPPTRPPLPPIPEGLSVAGIFEGRTPCHDLVVEVMQVTPVPGCLKIKWRITLYQDEANASSGTYLSMGTSTFREGTWEIVRGLDGNPDAVVYRLHLGDNQTSVSLLRVDENHLFLLDGSMNLLVGNELFSYTLSRAAP